jgi:phosphate transport system substrate-binding protein
MRKHNILFVFVLMLLLLPTATARAQSLAAPTGQPYRLQGSATFVHRIMEPYRDVIEASSGHKLTIAVSQSSRGLLALFEKRCDFAMVSGPLNGEIEALQAHNPDLPFDRLTIFNITSTRVAFAVNPENPVHDVSDDDMRRILLGEIKNWRDVGGRDQPIRIVMVREGGGVQSSIESEFLSGKKVNVAGAILTQLSAGVVKTTAVLPEALGLMQVSLARSANLVELKMQRPIEQRLDLVTLGAPTPEMRKVIDAVYRIISNVSLR